MRLRALAIMGTVVCAVLAMGTALSGVAGVPTGSGNPGTVTLADPTSYSAVYALSDVHGMYAPLQKLLTQNGLIDSDGHWSGGHALLIVVGDSIDKGSQSIEVLDQWIRLVPEAQAAGGRVLHLLGNHEAEFLADPTPSDDKAKALFDELTALHIPLEQLTSAQYARGGFLRSLPIAARVGNWLFCHAGLMPAGTWDDLTTQARAELGAGLYRDPFLVGDDSILEAKKWWKPGSPTRSGLEARLDHSGLTGVIFGHQPKALGVEGKIAISDDGRLVKLDNGMAPEAGSHPGSLLRIADPAELVQTSAQKLHATALIDGTPRALAPENLAEPSD